MYVCMYAYLHTTTTTTTDVFQAVLILSPPLQNSNSGDAIYVGMRKKNRATMQVHSNTCAHVFAHVFACV